MGRRPHGCRTSQHGTGRIGPDRLRNRSRGSASEQQATEGFRAALQRLASKVEIVAMADGRWDVTVAYQKTLDILARFPGIDGFYAADDTIGSAVIRALKQNGYTPGQVRVVAQGGAERASPT